MSTPTRSSRFSMFDRFSMVDRDSIVDRFSMVIRDSIVDRSSKVDRDSTVDRFSMVDRDSTVDRFSMVDRFPIAHRPLRALAVLVAAGAVGLIPGCGGDSPLDPTPPGGEPVIAVTVTPPTSTMSALGETLQLNATQTRDGVAVSGASFTWAVSEGEAVEVDASGTVTAVANGSATVKATSSGRSGTASITVQQASAALQPASGDFQFAEVGQPLDSALVVRLVDAAASPVAGESVAFTVVGGGSLDVEEAETDSLGTVTTNWTLGTGAGTQEVLARLVADSTVEATFTATAGAGPVATLVLSSGDAQSEVVDYPLPQPIVARVEDQFGNPVANALIHFEADAGTLAEAEVESDLDGTAGTIWTMGATPGAHLATATLDSTLIAPEAEGTFSADFTATAVLHALNAPADPVLVAGQTITLTGTGFHVTPVENTVIVDGVEATVLGGTQSSLEIVVPAFGCVPEKPVQVAVQRDVLNAETPAQWRPANPLELAVGERRVIRAPEDFCLQFLEDDEGEEYLIGVTATAALNAEMSFALLGHDGETAPSLPAPAPSAPSFSAGLAETPDLSAIPDLAATPALFPAPPVVGESRTFKVPDISGDICNDFTSITTTVWAVSDHSALLTDDANPPAAINLYDPTPFLNLFDNTIFRVVTDYLGGMTDFGGNGKVLIVLTRQVNLQGEIGFTTAADLFDSAGCASSDGAEIIYVAAPDPANQLGLGARTAAALFADFPPMLSHELTHVVQAGRRIAAGAPLLSGWIADGQAQLVQEAVGFDVLGNTIGQNYGASLFNTVADALEWYGAQFSALSHFYGWDGAGGRRSGAPERCSLFGSIGASTACDGAFGTGAAWSFLRYASDRFGGADPAPLQRAILNGTPQLDDLVSLENALDIPFRDLLVDWAAALYLDGRVAPGVAPELQLSSWNLGDIFGARPEVEQLLPPEIPFETFSFSRAIIAGGTSYTVLTQPAPRKPLAVRVRSEQDQTLSTVMGPTLWVVRVR